MTNLRDHLVEMVVRSALVASTLCSEPGVNAVWPAYDSAEADMLGNKVPDEAVIVTGTTGNDDGRTMEDGALEQHYGFQVMVRGKTPTRAGAKANAIRLWMSESTYIVPVTVEGSQYRVHAFTRIGQPLALGKDAQSTRRNLVSINATAAVRQV